MKKSHIAALAALVLVLSGVTVFGALSLARALLQPRRTDRALSGDEAVTVKAAAALMQAKGLKDDAALAVRLQDQGLWRAATNSDPYLKAAEKAGDTPFAYTLSGGHHPSAIVLAPRFFTETTAPARAALMIHEMGHYRAYVATGRSDEYDGYKPEYDTHAQLGLGENDGLTYFSLLDGVVEYVVPRDKSYQSRPDVQAFIKESDGS